MALAIRFCICFDTELSAEFPIFLACDFSKGVPYFCASETTLLTALFLAGAFRATFLAGAFFAGAFLDGAFFATFLREAFFFGAFLAGAFLAGAFLATFLTTFFFVLIAVWFCFVLSQPSHRINQ